MRNGHWTKDDLDTLRLYAEQGRSVYRIAAALNRSVSGVRTTAHRLGITIRAGRNAINNGSTEAASLTAL